jgi:hypothetical protein
MSGIEITCLKSFLDHGHRVTVFAYDDTDVPGFLDKADAASIVPRDRLFTYKCEPGRGSVAGFANYFRYRLLEKYCDWWIDTDVLCLSGDWPEPKGAVAGYEDDEHVAIGVLALPPDLARIAAARCEELGDGVVWGQTGPRLVTQLFRDRGLKHAALPRFAFYPIHWMQWTDPFDRHARERAAAACAGSLAVHLWHELIRRSGLDKAWRPPDDTYFGAAVRRHGTADYFVPVPDEEYQRKIEDVRPRQ